jgi:hypothetical protein
MKLHSVKMLLAFLLVASFSLTSCRDTAAPAKPETPAKPEASAKPETPAQPAVAPQPEAKPEVKPEVPAKPVAAADLKYRLFFKGIDFEGEKGTVMEKKDFQKEKAYMSCFDSEHFSKFQIDGNAGNISLTITQDGKKLFSKENIAVTGSKIFTPKDFSLDGDGGIGYIMTIKQGDSVLFEGKVDSQGCM